MNEQAIFEQNEKEPWYVDSANANTFFAGLYVFSYFFPMMVLSINDIFDDPGPLDDLIEVSGGYPRDFLRMMREVLLTAIMEKKAPPIKSTDLERIVSEVISSQIMVYDKPIFDEDLPPTYVRRRASLIETLRDLHGTTRRLASRVVELEHRVHELENS